MNSTDQHRQTAEHVVGEILMDSDNKDGECFSDNESDTESDSLDASLDLQTNIRKNRVNIPTQLKTAVLRGLTTLNAGQLGLWP